MLSEAQTKKLLRNLYSTKSLMILEHIVEYFVNFFLLDYTCKKLWVCGCTPKQTKRRSNCACGYTSWFKNQKVGTQNHQIIVNVDIRNDTMSIVISCNNFCIVLFFDAFDKVSHL